MSSRYYYYHWHGAWHDAVWYAEAFKQWLSAMTEPYCWCKMRHEAARMKEGCTHLGWWRLGTASAFASLLHLRVAFHLHDSTCVPPLLHMILHVDEPPEGLPPLSASYSQSLKLAQRRRAALYRTVDPVFELGTPSTSLGSKHLQGELFWYLMKAAAFTKYLSNLGLEGSYHQGSCLESSWGSLGARVPRRLLSPTQAQQLPSKESIFGSFGGSSIAFGGRCFKSCQGAVFCND